MSQTPLRPASFALSAKPTTSVKPTAFLRRVRSSRLAWLAASLLVGETHYDAMPMKDRDIFDFLGFD